MIHLMCASQLLSNKRTHSRKKQQQQQHHLTAHPIKCEENSNREIFDTGNERDRRTDQRVERQSRNIRLISKQSKKNV